MRKFSAGLLLGLVAGATAVHVAHEFNKEEYVVTTRQDTFSGDVRVEVRTDGPMGYGIRSETFDFRNDAGLVHNPNPFPLFFSNSLTLAPPGSTLLQEDQYLFMYQTDSFLLSNPELELAKQAYSIFQP